MPVNGSVAQLDRASAFEAEGCRFESYRGRHFLIKRRQFFRIHIIARRSQLQRNNNLALITWVERDILCNKTSFRDARLADLNGAIEKYADYHPGGVIVAIVERECGAFGQN